jgi:hypothetical protein
MSKVGLVIGHLFFANDKEMTQNSEHYPPQQSLVLSQYLMSTQFEIVATKKSSQ